MDQYVSTIYGMVIMINMLESNILQTSRVSVFTLLQLTVLKTDCINCFKDGAGKKSVFQSLSESMNSYSSISWKHIFAFQFRYKNIDR